SLGSKQREEGWDDFTWMHRDWVNWCWLSGDHIVEQHIHNIDVINWAIGSHPIKAVSFGSRQRRATGDQYDNFSTDFTYPGPNKDFPEIHVHSMCRQINGCPGRMAERVVGTKGISDCNGWISAGVKVEYEKNNQNVQEHKDLIDAIRSGKELNEAQNVAESTLSAIMARTAAYTGQDVTWDEIMKADWELKMPEYKLTEENWLKHVPVPGKAS
ncbi:MAG: oxidoreductase, partial [Phycisphaerae bacterium]|nr:oxidoreductase [Phycisphaerae bacterium]